MVSGAISKLPVLVIVILAFSGVSVICQKVEGDGTAGRISCDELRREVTSIMQRVFENKASPKILRKLIPKWLEMSVSFNCSKQQQTREDPRLSITQVNDQSLTIQHEPKSVLSIDIVTRSTPRPDYGQQPSLDAAQTYRTTYVPGGQYQPVTIIKNKLKDNKSGEPVLVRAKRFLGSGPAIPDFGAMSLGSPTAGGQPREISDSAQLMNNLLMFSKLQKNMLSREYGSIRRQGSRYVGDRVSFGSGYYGDVYTGRRKREILSDVGSLSSKENSRKKRFIFFGEPAEGPGTQQTVFGSLFGHEPIKRPELGGDYMKRAMGSTFLSFLPPGMQPPPGKDPLDFIKSMAPLFSQSNVASPGSFKKRTSSGLFGDTLPGKRRRRRSSNSMGKGFDVLRYKPQTVRKSFAALFQPALPSINKLVYSHPNITHNNVSSRYHYNLLSYPNINAIRLTTALRFIPTASSVISFAISERKKRSTNSDVITIGDISIPLDFFKPFETTDDSKSEQDASNKEPKYQPKSDHIKKTVHKPQNANKLHTIWSQTSKNKCCFISR